MVARMRGAMLGRTVAALAIAAGAGLGITVACGTGDISDLTAGRPDAGGGEGGGIDSSVCNHATAPERPTTPDAPNTPSLVFAFNAVRFDTDEQDGGLPKPQGLDLDMTCTCADPKLEPESCVPPDAGVKRLCDGVDGRDNAAGPLISAASLAANGVGPAAFQKKIESGNFNVLMTVDGWNGLPDDPAVVVGVLLSSGVEGSQSDASAPPFPKFDGTDVWTVSPVSVLGGVGLEGTDCRLRPATCIPLKVDTSAYVRDNTIVAHLDIEIPLESSLGAFQIDYRGATTRAKIVKDGNLYRVTGEIVGRWPIQRLLPSLARLPNPAGGGRPLCATDSGLEIYAFVKRSACEAVDLAANPTADRTSARCDAISNAITFTATTATTGTIYQPSGEPSECPDFTDTCEK